MQTSSGVTTRHQKKQKKKEQEVALDEEGLNVRHIVQSTGSHSFIHSEKMAIIEYFDRVVGVEMTLN